MSGQADFYAEVAEENLPARKSKKSKSRRGFGGAFSNAVGPVLRTVSPYNRVNTNAAVAGGATSLRIATRSTRPIGSGDVSMLKVRVDNISFKSDSTVAGWGNALNVIGMYIELPGLGLTKRVTMNGQNTWSIPDGQYDVYTDPIYPSDFGLLVFARNTDVRIRSEIEVGPSQFVPSLEGTDTGASEGKSYDPAATTLTNLAAANIGFSFTGVAAGNVFGIGQMLVGTYVTGTDPDSWILSGDSIFAQGNRQSYGVQPMYVNAGAYRSAVQVGRTGGQSTVQINYPAIVGSYTKLACSAIEEYGTNNAATSNLAALQALALASWAFLRATAVGSPIGKPFRIIRPYLLLRTSGTFATLVDQVIDVNWDNGAKVDLINAWYTTQQNVGNGPNVVFDPRQGVGGTIRGAADGSDPNFWKWAPTPLTGDGLHPNAAAATILGNNLAAVM